MDVLSIKILERSFGRDALGQSSEGIFFAPEFVDLSVGSSVWIAVHHKMLKAPVYLEALAAWRRLATTAAGRKGTGFRVMSHHVERLNFLRRVNDAELANDHRTFARYPCSEKVIVSMGTRKKTTARLIYGTLEDIGPEGALLTTPVPLDPHENELTLELSSTPGHPMKCHVVWRNGTRSGFRIMGNTADANMAWRKAVDRVGSLVSS